MFDDIAKPLGAWREVRPDAPAAGPMFSAEAAPGCQGLGPPAAVREEELS